MLPELYETHQDDEPVTAETYGPDPVIARSLLIEYFRNQRKADKLHETLDAVAVEYQDRIAKIEARQVQVREMLLRFVQDTGSAVSFPDVGGAHVTQRKPAPRISDPAALLAWAHIHAPTYIETTEKVPAKAVTELVKALEGELPDGVEVHHPEPTVTIKGRQ